LNNLHVSAVNAHKGLANERTNGNSIRHNNKFVYPIMQTQRLKVFEGVRQLDACTARPFYAQFRAIVVGSRMLTATWSSRQTSNFSTYNGHDFFQTMSNSANAIHCKYEEDFAVKIHVRTVSRHMKVQFAEHSIFLRLRLADQIHGLW